MKTYIAAMMTIVSLPLLLTGCGDSQPQKRQYQEILISTPKPPPMHAGGPAAPSGPGGPAPEAADPGPDLGPVKWTKPEPWQEEAGGGMRLVTFRSGTPEAGAECTIVSLGGAAGGHAANIKRWLGQINIDSDEATLGAYVAALPKFTSEGGYDGVIADLGLYNPELPDDADSMLTAIINRGNQSVFVKMTGKKAYLAKEKPLFEALCKSIQ